MSTWCFEDEQNPLNQEILLINSKRNFLTPNMGKNLNMKLKTPCNSFRLWNHPSALLYKYNKPTSLEPQNRKSKCSSSVRFTTGSSTLITEAFHPSYLCSSIKYVKKFLSDIATEIYHIPTVTHLFWKINYCGNFSISTPAPENGWLICSPAWLE